MCVRSRFSLPAFCDVTFDLGCSSGCTIMPPCVLICVFPDKMLSTFSWINYHLCSLWRSLCMYFAGFLFGFCFTNNLKFVIYSRCHLIWNRWLAFSKSFTEKILILIKPSLFYGSCLLVSSLRTFS